LSRREINCNTSTADWWILCTQNINKPLSSGTFSQREVKLAQNNLLLKQHYTDSCIKNERWCVFWPFEDLTETNQQL